MTCNLPTRYRSYLLRLWAEGGDTVWRFSLEDPRTGERRGFADLAELTAFLAGETDNGQQTDQRTDQRMRR